jgi:hypothetical protein
MEDELRSEIIKSNPIGNGLSAFRDSFNSVSNALSIASSPSALDQMSIEGDKHKVVA